MADSARGVERLSNPVHAGAAPPGPDHEAVSGEAGSGGAAAPPPRAAGAASPVLTGPEPADRERPGEEYVGHPISMDFQGVDLRSVLRTFAEISGLNMVIDPDVQGTVDIVLTDVPWDQALEVILRGNKLDYTVDGTIVRIARHRDAATEQDARTQLAVSAANAGALDVRTYTLSYAKADQVGAAHQDGRCRPRGQFRSTRARTR